jgi:hypothetical protein
VPGRAPEPSRSRVDDDGGDGTFRGIMIGCLGFSEEGVYMGEDLTPGEPCGPHTTCSRAGGGPVPPGGVGAPQPPSVSPSVSVYVTGKY